jgi:hypothetical protein
MFVQPDPNRWQPPRQYPAALAVLPGQGLALRFLVLLLSHYFSFSDNTIQKGVTQQGYNYGLLERGDEMLEHHVFIIAPVLS